jgi:ABC-type transport system involved in cytochrome bd biosynthesis fused ATPase/permease subunit
MYTILFCVLPILIALMPYVLVALQTYAAMLAEAQREELAKQRVQALQEKTATAQALRELKIIQEHNKIAIQEEKLNTEVLKQEQLRQRVGSSPDQIRIRDGQR